MSASYISYDEFAIETLQYLRAQVINSGVALLYNKKLIAYNASYKCHIMMLHFNSIEHNAINQSVI